MPRYAAPFTKTGADNVQQIVEVLSSATVQRTKWYMFVVACTTTPADALFNYVVRRTTNSMTGTALTPNPIDTQDAACRATSEHLGTADAASWAAGTEVFRAPVNHRAAYTFYAGDGMELVGPATNGAGLGMGVAANSTNTFAGTVCFAE